MGMVKISRKIGVYYYILLSALTTVVSIITVSLMQILGWELFLPVKYIDQLSDYYRYEESLPGFVQFFTYSIPFALTLIMGVIYFFPFFRKKSYEESCNIILSRVSITPVYLLIASFLGWFLSSVVQLIIFILSKLPFELFLMSFNNRVLIPILTGVLIGIFMYYLGVFINKRWILITYFSNGEILSHKNTIKFKIRSEFLILYVATTVLPLLFVNIISLSQGGDAAIPILVYSLFFLIISFFVSAFISYSYSTPLARMDSATREIQRGNYTVNIPVVSGDEIGRLGNSLNHMVKGLKEKEFIKETFGRVVDPAVRDHLLEGNIDLGGQSSIATVLFCDIRGFTTLSETLDAQTIVEMLNRYFTVVNRAVVEEGGLVNKFVGDAVLAIFGVPVEKEDHGDAAIRAGLKILKYRDELNKVFQREGLPEIKCGVGIHTGNLISGNIGSEDRMEYTVIGDTVNVASRLEGLCKERAVEIILSQDVTETLLRDYTLESLGEVTLKGRKQTIKVFTTSDEI